MPNFTVLNPLVDTIPSTPHEIRIEDAVAKYSEALNLLCQKDFARARDIFEELIVEFEDEGYDSSDEASETTRAKHLRYLVHKNFSQLLNKCNQPALAIKQAELALSVKHTDAYLWCELGELLLSAHKFPEAVGAFTSGLDLSLSKFTSAKCLRGICEGLFNMGDFESCLLYLEKAIEMDPGYHRGLWIKNKILDEYSGYADFSLKHRGFSGGVFAFSGPASVPRKRANIEDLFDLIKMTNPEYFESLTRERIIPWVDNEKQYEKVKYKVIEVTRKSFYHLGLRLIEELSAILESLKEVCHSPLPLLRIKFSHPAQSDAKSSYSWDKDSAEIPQNIVLQGNYGDSIVSLQKKADTSAADSTLATAPGTGDIQVARKGSPHQGGRRASKRLEGKAKRPESSDYYHYEKIDDIFSDLTNLRYTLGMDSGLFCPEAESTDSVIYDSYMNLLSHPKEAQRQPEERDPGTVDSKCDNRRYNDEAMFGEFIESVLNLECDIIHIARVYCLFAVTECIDLSCHSNYDGVNEKRWCAGTKKNIVKILTEIEKYDMGLNFWIMQTPDNMRNLLFAFVLSLGEVLSDFGNCDFPHDITASDDTGEGFQDYINTCSCPKCLLNGYINALRLINVSSELPMNLVIRFYWLLAKSIEASGDYCAMNIENHNIANDIYVKCLHIVSISGSDKPVLTYSKYPSCITRDFIAEKLLSMEVRGFCHALKYLPTDYNHDHFKRLCDLYLTEPGVVDSSISQEFRSMLNKETSEKVRLEMLDTLREVCSRLQDISEKLVVSSCIFSHAIVTLCSFRDSTASIEGSISAARNFLEVFERLDHSNSNWIDVLKTKQAILSDGRRVSLLDFFLNSCYIAGNIASLLIKGYDNWSSSKKAQSHSYYKLLLSFCIVSWRMLVPLVISSLAGEKSKSLPNDPGHSTCGLSSTVLRFISSAHHHLSLYNLCDAADGEFLLGEITHIKSFGSRNDTDDEREELNQCYRCLYGVYLKDIQTEDHQTSRQQLTEAAALDLFLRISRAIDDENIHISKLMFQDYAELLVRIGEVLEKNISCKKSILSYNASVLERLLSRPQSYCCPLSRLKLSFLKFPLDRLESEELAEFCEKFYYVSGRAAKGQSVCRRGPVQLVNPEKTASILDLAIRKFNKGLCVSFDNWRVWMHLGNCYAALENEYLGRSASYVVKNWSSIDKFRRRAFNSFVVALQLCNDSISRISEENSKRELLDDAGKIWGFLGELCYNIYDLPSIYPVRTRTRNSIERTRRVTRRMLELKLKNFGNMYEGASGNGGSAHFGLSIERDTVDKNEPASYLYEKTTSAVRMEEQNYHTLKRLIREDEVEFDERRLEIEEAPSFKLEDPDHAAAFSALENCYPFTRSGEILKFAAFALKRALALSKSARKNWLYHMLLGSASYIIGASNELSIDYYITSILLSSKEVLAKEQETILEPYIELIKFVCMSYITKRMSLHELEGLKEALSETDDRVFQMSRPIRKPGEYKTQGFIEPFIANSDLLEPKGTSAVVGDDVSNCNNSTGTFDFLNELVLRVRSEDKKGWHHEHSSLTYILYYFVKRDIEAAKDGFKVLLRLHGGKSKGFLNIWRTDYERPGNLFLCTHKYILFSLMLFKSTQDIKSLRRLIKKLCKSADKLLWPDLIAEKSSNACIECLESVLEKKIPKNYVLCEHEYSKTTSNSQIIGNLSSAIAEIITPDINHLLEALCLSFEINEYLRIGSENKLAHLQLQIYVYFVGSVIDEVNKRLHSNPGAPLVREETEASLNIIKDFFSKNEMENAVAQDSERQVLQFAKILIRPIATLVSKQPQCSGIDQVSAK